MRLGCLSPRGFEPKPLALQGTSLAMHRIARVKCEPAIVPNSIPLSSTGGELGPPLGVAKVVLDEVLSTLVGGTTNHNRREVPTRVVPILVERAEDLEVQRLHIRVCPAPVQGMQAHSVRCELERFVCLPPLLDELLHALPDHVVGHGHEGHEGQAEVRRGGSEGLAREVRQKVQASEA